MKIYQEPMFIGKELCVDVIMSSINGDDNDGLDIFDELGGQDL